MCCFDVVSKSSNSLTTNGNEQMVFNKQKCILVAFVALALIAISAMFLNVFTGQEYYNIFAGGVFALGMFPLGITYFVMRKINKCQEFNQRFS